MIKVNHLSKNFKLYDSPSDRLKEIIFRRTYHHIYNALNDVSFTVNSGQTLGILGKNGAGKSTLLKIISGVIFSDNGTIDVEGKVTGLLELGTGFDKELTGLQNIISNGLLIGMTKEEIQQQQASIIEFSELGSFIKEPIRTYSSGMVMRLAFSIAMHAKPDCFLIDEALSVGDAHFQQKCMHYIKDFKQKGGSIIFVSHDLNAVKMLCDYAIVLDQGNIVAEGSPEVAVNHYNRIMAKLDEQENQLLKNEDGQNFGNKKAYISTAELLGEHSKSNMISSGEIAYLNVAIVANDDIQNVNIGFLIRDRFGQDIFGTNSHHLEQTLSLKKNQHYQAVFKITMELSPGKYTITLALHSQDNHIDDCYHWVDNLLSFQVAGINGYKFTGVCRLNSCLCVSER